MNNNNSAETTGSGAQFINLNENPRPSVEITNLDLSTNEKRADDNVKFIYRDENQTETLSFERPEAQFNIFDAQYYLKRNPDIAPEIINEYQSIVPTFRLKEANLPNFVSSSRFSESDGSTISFVEISPSFSNTYSGAIENYVSTGAAQGVSPSPLFNSEYYLEQNLDVASALAGGAFSGDPLLHYVSVGAEEGRDPNAFFDSDYYLEQNPDVAAAGYNPLEHYVLLGSSEGRDPSPNFDPSFYLSQNQDVAAAGIDPLTHFLVSGQDEGRASIAR